ncbi:hypothetical protein AAFN60_13565 [Roseibacillus persicicus]|uniref:hypothetical protein n=1 Tax=Roseibacillus persicicus TaxID=454148 RepID=UPI00398B5D74
MKRLLLACGLLFPTGFSNGAITIDDFSVGGLALNHSDSISQEGLDPALVFGGRRLISASSLRSAPLNLTLDTEATAFSFLSSDFGYLSLSYSIEPEDQIDLLACGDTAFLLSFSYVDSGFWRGSYHLTVDGVESSISSELFALEGPGTIEIPFSAFTSESTFSPAEIVFSASRVEPNLRLELASIATIPEPQLPLFFAIGVSFVFINTRVRTWTRL